MSKQTFDKIIQSGELIEWTVPGCLNAAQQIDTKIIIEATSDQEESVMLGQSQIDDLDNDINYE